MSSKANGREMRQPHLANTLIGKTALVTGASGGIGKAVISALQAAGAQTIYALDRVTSGDSTIRSVDIDLADIDAVARAIAELECTPEILVNAAAVYTWRDGLSFDAQDFANTMNVNVIAPFVIMRELGARIASEDREASFINITSIAAKRAFANQADYVASKGALVSLTRAAALDLAPNITVNAIAPGTVNTMMINQVAQDIAMQSGLSADAARKKLEEEIPMGRMQEPEEVAAAVIFLASNSARSISGETLTIDGGLSRD